MTLKSLQKPVVITIAVVASAAFALTFMPRSAEAAPIVRSYRVIPGYSTPGYITPGYSAPRYKRPFLFTPGYRPYTLIFKHLR